MISCSAVPAITSNGLSAFAAWYSYRAATAERVEVLSRDCVFARPIRIAPGTELEHTDKLAIAEHNLLVSRFCP